MEIIHFLISSTPRPAKGEYVEIIHFLISSTPRPAKGEYADLLHLLVVPSTVSMFSYCTS